MDLSVYLLKNTLWDVLLGIIPVVLGWSLASGLRRTHPAWPWLPLGVLWLLFLPNTCYLLTEIRHYLENNPYEMLREAPGHRSLVRFLFWSAFYLVFSGSGLLLFALAIRPVAGALHEKGVPGRVFFPLVFAGSAVGVYLGLQLRFNSWDLLRRPERVWQAVLETLLGPGIAWVYILGFTLFLAVAYLVVDIWFDGLLLRWDRLRTAISERSPGAAGGSVSQDASFARD